MNTRIQPPKYPSTPHWPQSEKLHRDDTYHTAPEWFVGRPVVVTEKIDGGNTCLHRGEVFARSVAAPARDGWFAMVKKHHAWKMHDMPANMSVYVEDIYGVHSIEYEPVDEDKTSYVFAVRVDDVFDDWSNVLFVARQLKIPLVPTVFRGVFESQEDITAFFKHELTNPSQLGGECEGFVMRTEEAFPAEHFGLNVCKYVRANHVQTDQHWRRNWRPCRLNSK